MRKRWIFTYLLLLLSCLSVMMGSSEKHTAESSDPTIQQNELKSVDPIGQIPEEFKSIVANNTFYGVTAFDGRLLKSEILSQDEARRTVVHQVRMIDIYGNDLAAYVCGSDDAYHVSTLTATNDGGFLFVLGFRDYAYDQNTWASDKGSASRIIKCDKDGILQFDTPIDGVEGYGLQYCIEKNGRFFFYGTVQTPETKTRGVYSPSDIYMMILDEKGTVLKKQCIAGSDFDSLEAAEITDQGFLLSIRSQSDDGDFTGSGSNGYPIDWVITVNEELEIIEKQKTSGRDSLDDRIGEKDGDPVYQNDALLKDFDGGTVTALVDYGEYYLVISENNTGVYDHTPLVMSSIWYYTETVYSLYDDSGNMVFRASVDSSPDYDAMIASMNLSE